MKYYKSVKGCGCLCAPAKLPKIFTDEVYYSGNYYRVYDIKKGDKLTEVIQKILEISPGSGTVSSVNGISQENIQLELTFSNGILSIVGGNISFDLDTRYLQHTDNIDWANIINNPDFATEQWVQNQNYLTQHQDISGKADKTVSITGVGALEGGGSLASSSSLDLTQDTKDDIAKGVLAEGWGNHADVNYATEQWVSSQGFLTQHQSLLGYATEQWVQSQNYLTQHQSLTGYATESWVESKSYLVAADISGKADKVTKVQGAGALEGGGDLSVDRTIDLTQGTKDNIQQGVTAHTWGNHSTEGYATESWVSSQGFSTQTLDNIEDTTEGVKVTGQVQANALIGRATNSNASGTYTIDFNNLSENYNLVLTDNTFISFTNMIAEDETAVFTLVVEGDFNFSVIGLDLDLDGDIYNTAGRNLIVIHIERGGSNLNYRGTYTIKNI